MKVNITLYKTNFDEENPFVSTSKSQRINDIATKFNEGKLVMENSSFNIETPFRIAKNFFDLDKKYNYAKYEYYNGNVLKDTRFYFIKSFKYVNDNITDMIVSEDIIGEHFWDLDIKYCMPQKYTYKDKDIEDRAYNTDINFSKTFIKRSEFNGLLYFSSETDAFKVGFIVTSAITNNENDIICKTEEDGVSYNINTYLIPFLYNDNGILNNRCTSIEFTKRLGVNTFTQSLYSEKLVNIDEFQKISKITSNGFKYISSFILLDVRNIVKSIQVDSDSGDFRILFEKDCIYNMSLDGFEGDKNEEGVYIPEITLMKITSFKSNIFNFSINCDNKKTVSNYCKLLFSVDGNYSGLDISLCKKNDIMNSIRFSISQSLIPPYSVSLNYETDKSNKSHIELQRNSSFMYIDDSYTEWLKTNRNASITGMQVRQDYETEIITKQMGSKMSSNMIRSQKGLITSVAMSGESGAYGKTLDLGLEWLASLSDSISAEQTVDRNHKKERALLELQIQDLVNTPDSVTMGNSVFFHFKNKKYINITYLENIRLNEILKTNKMFGYNTAIEIKEIKSHDIFDYIRSDTLTLSFKNNFNPSELERAIIENYFSNGIRTWYNINYYKNFEVENSEVSNE